jgi:hypothetical protein
VTNEAPPAGGAIADGTYALTRRYYWGSGCGGYTITLRETLRIRGAVFELATEVEKATTGPIGRRVRVFAVTHESATSLALHTTCDSITDAATGDIPQGLYRDHVPYSATATELRFFNPNSTEVRLEEVYARQ